MNDGESARTTSRRNLWPLLQTLLTLLTVLALLTLAACGGDGGTPPPEPEPEPPPSAQNIVVVGGADQTGEVGTELAVPIAVRVTAADGVTPVSGQLVNFVVVQGGGAAFAGSALTNAQGEARERWTLGTAAGAQALEARAVDQTSGQAIVFARVNATARPGPVLTLSLRRSDTLAFLGVSTDLKPLISTAADRFGNAVTGVVPAVSGAGNYTVSSGALTPAAEGDFALTLSAGTATAPLLVKARRDLRVVLGWRATWGCRNGASFNQNPILLQRHGDDIGGWILRSYDATGQVTMTYEPQDPFDPSRRSDGTVQLSATVHGTWQTNWTGTTITDTLTEEISATASFWQHPDSIVFRRGYVLNSDLGPSFARWVGPGIEGADWCTAAGPYYSGAVFRGADGQIATGGSFVPLVLGP